MTKEMVETIRKLAESHNFGGVPIPQLCDLAAESFDLKAALREALDTWELFTSVHDKVGRQRIAALRKFLDDK